MNNKKSTKRALITSILSLVLCMAMLIGTTFAWFTDSVTSANNKIQAGTLDIELWKVNSMLAETEQVKDEALFDYDLWEPGYAYATDLKLKNVGTLDAKFIMTIVPTEEVGELAEVIDVYYTINDFYAWKMATQWTNPSTLREAVKEEFVKLGTLKDVLNGTLKFPETALTAKSEAFIQIAMVMQESAGNQYQGKNAGVFDLRILATQLTSEKDSFDNQYDKFADYDGEISNAVSLAAALQSGGTYKVTSDIALDETVIVPAGVTVALDLNGKAVSGNVELAAGADATIVNGTVKNEDSAVSGIQNNGGNLTLKDVEIESARHGVRVEGGTVTIDGGVYKAAGTKGLTQHALNVSDGATVTINGGTFIGPKGTVSDSGAAVNVQAGSTVIINDGNFSGGKNNTLASKGTLKVYGGTFDQNPSAYVVEGYAAVKNADGTYTVSKKVVPEGTTLVSEGLYVDADGVYYITNATGFDGMREKVASEEAYEKDGTWILYNDIDLNGVNWTPIAGFHGIFDGNDKTISNMNASFLAENGIGGTDYGVVCTIKDVTFHKATITGTEGVGVVVSNGVGVTIENVKVTESTVIGTKYVGGIVGVVNKAVSTITGCP